MTSNQQEVEHDPMNTDAHRADHRPPRARIPPLARSTRVAHTLPLGTRG